MENYFIKSQGMAVKADFTMKVMNYVALALAMTTLGAYLAPHILPLNFLLRGGQFVIFIVEIVLIFTASKWSQLARPINILIYLLFAFLSGLTLYPLLLQAMIIGGIAIIAKALIATVCLSLAAGIYAKTTQRDLSGMGGFLTMGLIGLIIVGVLQIFWPSPVVQVYASGLGVILFSGFIAYDVQQIARYPENRAIEAAIGLYLSIFNLFTSLLRLLMMTRD